MSESKSEVSSKRRRFSEEFKQDAVRLVVSEEYSFKAAATAVGVSEQALRHWYRKLLRFYSRQYRERFAESMEQTFNDLCRERTKAGKGLLTFALWAFCETLIGIMKVR